MSLLKNCYCIKNYPKVLPLRYIITTFGYSTTLKLTIMKRILPLFFLIFFAVMLSAQTELSSFTSTGSGYATSTINDYQSLGINPANLGWTRNDHSMNIGFFETALSIYSEALTKKTNSQ